jgi:hypothetical protein
MGILRKRQNETLSRAGVKHRYLLEQPDVYFHGPIRFKIDGVSFWFSKAPGYGQSIGNRAGKTTANGTTSVILQQLNTMVSIKNVTVLCKI